MMLFQDPANLLERLIENKNTPVHPNDPGYEKHKQDYWELQEHYSRENTHLKELVRSIQDILHPLHCIGEVGFGEISQGKREDRYQCLPTYNTQTDSFEWGWQVRVNELDYTPSILQFRVDWTNQNLSVHTYYLSPDRISCFVPFKADSQCEALDFFRDQVRGIPLMRQAWHQAQINTWRFEEKSLEYVQEKIESVRDHLTPLEQHYLGYFCCTVFG